MIHISPRYFDINDTFTFRKYENTHANVNRRITRTKTLDEQVYIDDSGFTVGDNDLIVYVDAVDDINIDNLLEVCRVHSEFTAVTKEGNYKLFLSTVVHEANVLTLTFFVFENG